MMLLAVGVLAMEDILHTNVPVDMSHPANIDSIHAKRVEVIQSQKLFISVAHVVDTALLKAISARRVTEMAPFQEVKVRIRVIRVRELDMQRRTAHIALADILIKLALVRAVVEPVKSFVQM